MACLLLAAEATTPPETSIWITVIGYLVSLFTIIGGVAVAIWKGILPISRDAQKTLKEMNAHCHESLDDSTKRFTDALKERDERMREQTKEFASATAALTRLHDSLTRIEQKWN